MRTDILGVGFDDISMEEAVKSALSAMEEKNGFIVVTPNPEIVYSARKNAELASALREADMVLPDGIGVIYGARMLKTPLRQKLPGIDFAARLMGEMAKTGKSVYLLGAAPGVAARAADKLAKRFPGLVLAGAQDGYFDGDAEVIGAVNKASPDFLMVCLGSPKQELWMSRNREGLSVGVMAGLGGSLNIFAGDMKRAPERWQKMGLEWLYRLLREPRRIGRAVKLPLFLLAVAKERSLDRARAGR